MLMTHRGERELDALQAFHTPSDEKEIEEEEEEGSDRGGKIKKENNNEILAKYRRWQVHRISGLLEAQTITARACTD